MGLGLIIITVKLSPIMSTTLPQLKAGKIPMHAYVIESGSMEPGIKLGSLVLVTKQPSYKINDVITFVSSENKTPTTHRIYLKIYPENNNESPVYLTKGDANKNYDNGKVAEVNIVGKVLITFPYLGYAADFTKKPQGFIFLIIVPATIIIYEELKKLRKELAKGVSILKNKYRPEIVPVGVSAFNPLSKLVIIIPVIGAGLILIAAAKAFFIDREASQGNVFSAATSFSSPTPVPTPHINQLNDLNPDSFVTSGGENFNRNDLIFQATPQPGL